MAWLLTGGAGYIGSHIVEAFRGAGREVVVLDDLSSGFAEFVPDGVVVHEGRVEDPAAVAAALDAQPVDGVVHLAGLKYAGESVHVPLDFYRANVEGTRVLLEAMAAREIDRLVFSSSSATYGTMEGEVVTEDAPQRPESPYGESKLVGEWLIRDQARARPALRHTSLRYFNVVGSGSEHLVDHSPYNLFPLVFRALARGERPKVFGDDYPTPDGTCIRDYVHVSDLAEAHLRAAVLLEEGRELAPAYNVGRGEGVSVRQIVETILRAVGEEALGYDVVPRRGGDPARIVGSARLIERDFGWKPDLDLDAMVDGAWAAWNAPGTAEREARQDAARAARA
ncbi:UDP-glucose 4-epimerase GalE [Patulibacter sp. SYSU D01012]|uniref:UDP-glucose 4-epimerase GalE n=1 Tax=Patulibacter sp. SYSU D01012 TaxID=2817381 RepID=UPI001B304C93|nr:UDP-glucose 4-epimerase GalE [Patulibacter sp. SYSU D01012]